ncbi:MAG: crossover junction endodeoxyribonuclease RuvC [Calditrichaeota bacterium]|nr:MAG: crossover junction endodeoxyribonuclease RuvC [Calditrichota bacterium]
MVILGIDPGLSVTGYGVIEIVNQKVICRGFGGIYNKGRKKEIADKLQTIYDGVCQVIDEFHPQVCAIEEVFYHENVNTAIVMGHARGVAMVAARKSGLEVFEYAAREIKMSIVGFGAASKHQVQAMVQSLLQMSQPPRPQDAADALAVALCHYHRLKFHQLTRNMK